MKLQGLSIVFGLIVMPLILVLSYYISLQVDTISLQTSYDTKLLDATHDAMVAFEMNTANEDLSSVADSLRSIIEASNNIFINTLATNMGLSNASKSYIQSYVPAVLYTLYDGYYIYSPTKKPEIGVDYNGVALEINSKPDNDNLFSIPFLSYHGTDTYKYGPTKDGVNKYQIDEKKSKPNYQIPDSFYNALPVLDNSNADDFGGLLYVHKDDEGKDDEATLLTTDITKAKYNTEYVLKSYMPYSARYVKSDKEIDITVNYTLDNYLTIVGNIGNVYYTKSGYLIRSDLVQFAGGKDFSNYNENDAENEILNGQEVTIKLKRIKEDGTNEYITISTTQGDDAKRAVIYYTKAKLFSDWVYKNLNSIEEQDIVDAITETLVTTTEKGSEEIIYQFAGKTNKIFDSSEDPEKDNSTFVNHKYNVIRNSIQYNLNLAMSIYNNDTAEGYHFSMPVISNEEWDKIINNVSMVSFLQGLNCGLSVYNNYVVVSSTNNELTVLPDEIYFVDSTKNYHRINCPELEDTTLISFKSKEVKYDKIYNKAAGKYIYDHQYLACYTCIVDGNYTPDTLTDNKYYSYYVALAKERYNAYKMNAIKLSEGYEILDGIYITNSTRTLKEIKKIQITFEHIPTEDFAENTIAIKFIDSILNLPEDNIFVLNTNQSKEQTITITVNSATDLKINIGHLKNIENTNNPTKVKIEDIKNAIKSVKIVYK